MAQGRREGGREKRKRGREKRGKESNLFVLTESLVSSCKNFLSDWISNILLKNKKNK